MFDLLRHDRGLHLTLVVSPSLKSKRRGRRARDSGRDKDAIPAVRPMQRINVGFQVEDTRTIERIIAYPDQRRSQTSFDQGSSSRREDGAGHHGQTHRQLTRSGGRALLQDHVPIDSLLRRPRCQSVDLMLNDRSDVVPTGRRKADHGGDRVRSVEPQVERLTPKDASRSSRRNILEGPAVNQRQLTVAPSTEAFEPPVTFHKKKRRLPGLGDDKL